MLAELGAAPRVLARRALDADALAEAVDARLHEAWPTPRLAALACLSVPRLHARWLEVTDGEESRTLRPLQAAAMPWRPRRASGPALRQARTVHRTVRVRAQLTASRFRPRAGQTVLTLRGAMPRESAARQPLCADIDGFSLHAAVRVEANDRKRLEQPCRYVTRPALSDQWVQRNEAGQVELKLKTPWRDGTPHLVVSPLEFMRRLAALVPRPRLHLIRFHGVLAPNAMLRALVVPQGPEVQEQASEAAVASECEAETGRAGPHRVT